MYPREFDREKSPYLVLSIALHIIALLALIHIQWNTTLKDLEQHEQKEKELPPLILPLNTDVAALKPRASQFGAPIIFQEEPTFTPKNTDPVADNVLAEPEVHDTQQEQPHAQKRQPNSHEQEQEQLPNDLTLNSADIQKDTTSVAIAPEQDRKPEKHPQSAQAPQVQQKQQVNKTSHQSGSYTQDAAPVTRQLTFADLVHGFVQTIKNEGQDLLERKGNENIRPDLEEMKLISYKEKIVWFIQNAFRIRNDEEPPHPDAIVKCYTLMALKDDGNIINLQLVYSTGVTQFDKYYLDVLKSAAPFPPIPQHIKKPFVFPFTMVYYTRPKNIASQRHQPPRIGFAFKR